MNDTWTLLVDFDGTLTETDTELFVASKLLSPNDQRLRRLFNAYESIEIGLLDYFYGYLALVDIESERFLESVVETPMRKDVLDLILFLKEKMTMFIVSEGLDVYIHPLLEKHGLDDVPLICNRLVKRDGVYRILPAENAKPCDRCLSCKGALVRRIKQERAVKVAVIGNGASDFCAAREADAVFARDSLAHLCTQHSVSFTPWIEAADIDISIFFT
jgi:2-hydroxy-3-keto-5-methylthiopentenyl-1-phosphate phosphatase